jgi:fermentation-respiration switch protein FrsA (DUF1100 family)
MESRKRQPSSAWSGKQSAITPATLAFVMSFVAIHSTKDEFVSVDDIKRVMGRALEPKQLWLIEADDHRFSGKEQELNQKLLDAIAWIKSRRR